MDRFLMAAEVSQKDQFSFTSQGCYLNKARPTFDEEIQDMKWVKLNDHTKK